jgi:hypothetical protein
LYGLDIDLLESLNMGDLIKENQKKRDEPRESNEFSNMNMEQMRKTFGIMPAKTGAAKLRAAV